MSSQVTFTRMEEAVAFELGWDRTSNNWSTDRDNLFETIKKDGLSLFENCPTLPNERTAHQWSWLYPFASMELSPSYSTGTIQVVDGTVGLSTGAWPSWAAQGDLWYTDSSGSSVRHPVLTRTNDTTLTIADNGIEETAATYTLRRHSYDLPSNFGGMYSTGFAFRRDSTQRGRTIKQVGGHELRMYDNTLDSVPCVYSLEPITTSNTTTWLVKFAPLPDAAYFLEYQYRAIMGDVTSGNAYGGAVHSETILAAIRHVARQRVLRDDSLYGDFMRKLEMSVRYDRQNYKPTDFGTGRSHEVCDGYTGLHRHSSIDDATFSFS